MLPSRRPRAGGHQFLRSRRYNQHAAARAADHRREQDLGAGGRFHLAPAPDDYLRKVMAELQTFDLEHVLPMHCSGANFIALAKQEIPEKLVLCGTGSSFTFT